MLHASQPDETDPGTVRSAAGLARDALGVGFRPTHYRFIVEHWPAVDFFEIISENFMGAAHAPRQKLDKLRERYPIVLHGVSLNLLGHAPLDRAYLEQVRRLADHVDAAFVTDHLCWTGAHGVAHHDLLPIPYRPEIAALAAERAAFVQDFLGRPFGLENLSSYVSFSSSTMSEHELYTQTVKSANCSYMLDINNIYVSSVNHGFDPREYIDAIDFSRVLQVHLAGHTRQPDGILVDTHDHPICEQVWELYAYAWRVGGPFPTLVEWDAAIPTMPRVLAELDRAREVRG